MRRVLYDRSGAPQLYVTGAGVLYTLDDQPRALLQEAQVLSLQGYALGWLQGGFLRDAEGRVVAFVKGARGALELPPTLPLRQRPQPTPAPFHPLARHATPPPERWVWSPLSVAAWLAQGAVA